MPVPFEMAHDVLIDAPAQLVLDYVSNPQSWKEWCRPMPPRHHHHRTHHRAANASATSTPH